MTGAVVDLLPRDAELARRAAGGDGAAFVRLYDHYADDVFKVSLAATGSIESAAEATQRAFLRILRWPPALGAEDGDVVELLFALALGGERVPAPAAPDTVDARRIARLVGVGWLRSETVAKAGARFDADWSEHLWVDPPAAEPQQETRPEPVPLRRIGFRLRRPPLPSPAVVAATIVLAMLATGVGMVAAEDGTDPSAAQSEASIDEADDTGQGRDQVREAGRRSSRAVLTRPELLKPLLAP